MMNLTKKNGILGIRGHVLYVLIGLLVSGASSQSADTPVEAVSNSSAPATNWTVCPDGWLHVADQCLFITTNRDDYFNSTKKCTEIGGHLAILTTKEQHDVVEQEGKRIGGMFTYYWIGLSDIDNEGDWKWVDNSTLETPFWDVLKSEPDNHHSGGLDGEDCVVVHSYTQTWFDVPCSFVYPRICQMAALLLQ